MIFIVPVSSQRMVLKLICMALLPSNEEPGLYPNWWINYILYFFWFLFLTVSSLDMFISCPPVDLLKFLFAMLAIDLGKNSF